MEYNTLCVGNFEDKIEGDRLAVKGLYDCGLIDKKAYLNCMALLSNDNYNNLSNKLLQDILGKAINQ